MTEELVTLIIAFMDSDGRTLASSVAVRIPKEMKKKIAKMHVLDMIARTSDDKVDTALGGLGLK